MTTAKVEIKIGSLSFVGEGDKDWVAKQLDKLIQHAPELLRISPTEAEGGGGGNDAQPGQAGTLASFIAKSKGAKSNQIVKFLATAEWSHKKGHKRLSTRDVSNALDQNNQGSLTNPSDCLRKNVSKGYIEKSGRQFYVTDDGRKSLQ